MSKLPVTPLQFTLMPVHTDYQPLSLASGVATAPARGCVSDFELVARGEAAVLHKVRPPFLSGFLF